MENWYENIVCQSEATSTPVCMPRGRPPADGKLVTSEGQNHDISRHSIGTTIKGSAYTGHD
jgi:hypothetical protein